MFNLFYIIILLIIEIVYSKIEDIYKIFPFELINKTKKEPNSIIKDFDSTYIFPNNISLIKNLLIDGTSKDTLISTNLSDSVVLSIQNNTEEESPCLKDASKLQIINSQFNFQACGPYNISVLKEENEKENEIYNIFYYTYEISKSNSIIEYNAILALPSLKNVSMVILDYIDKNLKIIENKTYEDNIEAFNQSIKNMIKCEPGSYFSCKINYILFGMEGEKDDPFLAKKIEDEDAVAYFDNLSSYSIFPYEYLNYFLTSFFSKYNDKCEENEIKGTNLYYVTCSREKIEIFSYARNMSIIINNFAFPLKNLFNDTFKLLEKTSHELIYFNILFNKSSIDFIFGSHFFMGKQIGYNFMDNSTYIYSKQFIDFTSNFSGENSSTFQFFLYALTFGIFACFLILSAMMNWLHARQVNKELEKMIKS